jgi:hypothetical protein
LRPLCAHYEHFPVASGAGRGGGRP